MQKLFAKIPKLPLRFADLKRSKRLGVVVLQPLENKTIDNESAPLDSTTTLYARRLEFCIRMTCRPNCFLSY
jgi:hypothetical protein